MPEHYAPVLPPPLTTTRRRALTTVIRAFCTNFAAFCPLPDGRKGGRSTVLPCGLLTHTRAPVIRAAPLLRKTKRTTRQTTLRHFNARIPHAPLWLQLPHLPLLLLPTLRFPAPARLLRLIPHTHIVWDVAAFRHCRAPPARAGILGRRRTLCWLDVSLVVGVAQQRWFATGLGPAFQLYSGSLIKHCWFCGLCWTLFCCAVVLLLAYARTLLRVAALLTRVAP